MPLQVFQTAEHTRYQHCVGVAWLSLQLVEHLSNASYLREFGVAAAEASHDELCQVVLAGLAHDLGHGPFSHLWERCMHRSGHADWCGAPLRYSCKNMRGQGGDTE